MARLARSAAVNPSFFIVIESFFDYDSAPSLSSIEEWVREHFVFQPELIEIVRTPEYMLYDVVSQGWFSGDCDDASTFAAAILKVFNYPAEFVAIRYSNPSEFQHVFVQSGAFVIDPTVPYGTHYQELERMIQQV